MYQAIQPAPSGGPSLGRNSHPEYHPEPVHGPQLPFVFVDWDKNLANEGLSYLYRPRSSLKAVDGVDKRLDYESLALAFEPDLGVPMRRPRQSPRA